MKPAYINVFGCHRDPEIEKIDFALICLNEKQDYLGFITCKEMDAESVYWQFGGAFEETKNTIRVLPAYRMFIEWCSGKYKRITTRIENTNLAMIKLALKCGFLINGTWNFKNKIYLELCLEFGG